jgi:hypothetical protein
MRTRTLTVLSFVLPVFFSHSLFSQLECPEKISTECNLMLDKFTFTKSYEIKPSMYQYGGEKKEYSYMFSKGNTYVITICDQGSGKLLLDIYDRNKRVVTRNYDELNGKYYTKIYFPCAATGIYYLKYSFKDGKPSCAASSLGVQNLIVKKL